MFPVIIFNEAGTGVVANGSTAVFPLPNPFTVNGIPVGAVRLHAEYQIQVNGVTRGVICIGVAGNTATFA